MLAIKFNIIILMIFNAYKRIKSFKETRKIIDAMNKQLTNEIEIT